MNVSPSPEIKTCQETVFHSQQSSVSQGSWQGPWTHSGPQYVPGGSMRWCHSQASSPDHPEDAAWSLPLLTPPQRSSRISTLSSEGEGFPPSSPAKLLWTGPNAGDRRSSGGPWQPTSGPAPAFPSPHRRAAQRGLELPDLNRRVGAEALLELLHQGLHRLLRHFGSCNSGKGTAVRRGQATISPLTPSSWDSKSQSRVWGQELYQDPLKSPTGMHPALSKSYQSHRSKSVEFTEIAFFMLLSSILYYSWPLPPRHTGHLEASYPYRRYSLKGSKHTRMPWTLSWLWVGFNSVPGVQS